MKGILGRLYRGETKIDFIGKRRLWFSISGLIVLVCLLALPLRPSDSSCSPPMPKYFKGLNCGIEFKGGVAIQAPISEDSELADLDEIEIVDRVSEAVAEVGVTDPQVQVASVEGDRSVLVQTTELGDPEAQLEFQEVVRDLTGSTIEEASPKSVGRKWGGEITRKALKALGVFMVVILVFISWRFEWKMAASAILALVHDLTITAGVYAIVGFEVTPSTIIAILTILGYSLYDTVVVFDKVEEDTTALAGTGRTTYEHAANLAANEVFMRSLNTSLATVLPVGALLFVGAGLLGATTMKDLALALLVGLLVGAYSSIFLAVPFLSMLKEREPRFQAVREKLARGEARRGTPVEPAIATAGATAAPAEVTTPKRPAAQRGPARPPAGSKKAKRRKRR